MKIKKYDEFIKEGYSNDMKLVLLSFYDDNRNQIESKGLDFEGIRESLIDSLDSLDDLFLQEITKEFSSLSDLTDKQEFTIKFESILHKISDRLESKVSNENFITGIKNMFSYLRDKIKQAAKWISDRIFTISGLATMGLAGILFIINQWGAGLGMSEEFANVTINAVLVLGITAFTFGQKNDEYKQISEI